MNNRTRIMNIGLFGFEFQDENLGCVALTFSALDMLQNMWEDDEINIVNFCGRDEDISIAQRQFPKINIRQHVFRFGFRLFMFDALFWKELKKCDAVLDITYGDSFSDIYSLKSALTTTFLKRFTEKRNVPLILMPQTIGPFKNGLLKKLARKTIDKSYKVYTRDTKSQEFVNSLLPNKDVFVTTDLAMALPYETHDSSCEKVRIGINISGLLWKGGFSEENQFGLMVDYRVYVRNLLENLTNDEKYEVHLIPHVIETNINNSHDGDVLVVENLKREFPNVTCSPIFKSPIEAKSYISSMDVFIGARMHSTIAAFSSGVATIPFAYSRKFDGLYYSLGYRYIIDGRNLSTDEAVKLTHTYISDRENLKKQLNNGMQLVKNELYFFEKNLKETIEQICEG